MATEYGIITFDDLLKDTSPQTPGIIRSVALRELRLAMREFFEKSYAWTCEVPNIDTPAGNVPVQVTCPGSAEAVADPDFASVVLLLHMDGVDGATVAIDSSPSEHTMLFADDAEITTDQSQIGGSSLGVNNSTLPDQVDDSLYLNIGASTDFDFGTGEFTIEFFYRADESSGANMLLTIGNSSGGLEVLNIVLSNGNIGLELNGAAQFNVFTVPHVNDTWHHVVIQRLANENFECYFDGTESVSGDWVESASISEPVGDVILGGSSTGALPAQEFEGYIDEVRITKGVARYAGDFTVPTEEFPDTDNSSDPNVEVIAILTLTLRNVPVGAIGARPPQDDPDRTSDRPLGWFVTSNPDEFLFFPRLENSLVGETDALVAVIPSFDAVNIPRQIGLKYYDAIVNGYLSRVYAHPNKPYSAPANAAQLRHNFLRQIGFYMAQRKQGYNNSQQWTFPPGYNVKRLGGNG